MNQITNIYRIYVTISRVTYVTGPYQKNWKKYCDKLMIHAAKACFGKEGIITEYTLQDELINLLKLEGYEETNSSECVAEYKITFLVPINRSFSYKDGSKKLKRIIGKDLLDGLVEQNIEKWNPLIAQDDYYIYY